MAVIAITREMGAQGGSVARLFAEKTGYRVVHHELAEPQDSRGFRGLESEVCRFFTDETAAEGPHYVDGSLGFMTAAEVVELALEGNVLIRGWGAARLLHNVPQVVSLRVCAPFEARVAEMKRRLEVEETVARQEIKRSDAAHTAAFTKFFDTDWRDPQNYDLVLNTAYLSPEACADLLISIIKSQAFGETKKGRQALRDKLLQARISDALKTAGPMAQDASHIHVSVENDFVRLHGIVQSDEVRNRAEQIVARQAGLGALRNDLVRTGSAFT
ncbi:MAG: cytidylate kinase family protein [Pseudomonadota bacterium]